MAKELAFAKFVEATFEHLPLFFSRNSRGALDALETAGYQLTRQASGEPMLAMQIGEDAICIFASPQMPLPKARLIGDDAGSLFDRLADEILSRGFRKTVQGSPRPGMRVETFSNVDRGPIFAVTIMRPVASDRLLLAAAYPPNSNQTKGSANGLADPGE